MTKKIVALFVVSAAALAVVGALALLVGPTAAAVAGGVGLVAVVAMGLAFAGAVGRLERSAVATEKELASALLEGRAPTFTGDARSAQLAELQRAGEATAAYVTLANGFIADFSEGKVPQKLTPDPAWGESSSPAPRT